MASSHLPFLLTITNPTRSRTNLPLPSLGKLLCVFELARSPWNDGISTVLLASACCSLFRRLGDQDNYAMQVLNAAGLAPVASLHKATPSLERRPEPRRLLQFRLPKLAALSSIFGAGGLAKALTYEQALDQTVGSSSLDFDVGGLLDGIVNFGTENPLLLGGGALVLAVPLILSQILKKPKNWGLASAKSAYAKLSEDGNAQLLDIREGKDFKEVGRPDLRGLKKKAVAIAYRGEDKPGFLKKLESKFKDPTNTTLFILDK